MYSGNGQTGEHLCDNELAPNLACQSSSMDYGVMTIDDVDGVFNNGSEVLGDVADGNSLRTAEINQVNRMTVMMLQMVGWDVLVVVEMFRT